MNNIPSIKIVHYNNDGEHFWIYAELLDELDDEGNKKLIILIPKTRIANLQNAAHQDIKTTVESPSEFLQQRVQLEKDPHHLVQVSQ